MSNSRRAGSVGGGRPARHFRNFWPYYVMILPGLIFYPPMTYDVADIFDTYVYRSGIQQGKYSFSTALGLFQSVIFCIHTNSPLRTGLPALCVFSVRIELHAKKD